MGGSVQDKHKRRTSLDTFRINIPQLIRVTTGESAVSVEPWCPRSQISDVAVWGTGNVVKVTPPEPEGMTSGTNTEDSRDVDLASRIFWEVMEASDVFGDTPDCDHYLDIVLLYIKNVCELLTVDIQTVKNPTFVTQRLVEDVLKMFSHFEALKVRDEIHDAVEMAIDRALRNAPHPPVLTSRGLSKHIFLDDPKRSLSWHSRSSYPLIEI